MTKSHSFRLKFNGSWWEYLALGVVLVVFGNELTKSDTKLFLPIGLLLAATGLFYFVRGIYLGIKRIFKGKEVADLNKYQ